MTIIQENSRKTREFKMKQLLKENQRVYRYLNNAQTSYDRDQLKKSYERNRELYRLFNSKTPHTALHLGIVKKAKKRMNSRENAGSSAHGNRPKSAGVIPRRENILKGDSPWTALKPMLTPVYDDRPVSAFYDIRNSDRQQSSPPVWDSSCKGQESTVERRYSRRAYSVFREEKLSPNSSYLKDSKSALDLLEISDNTKNEALHRRPTSAPATQTWRLLTPMVSEQTTNASRHHDESVPTIGTEQRMKRLALLRRNVVSFHDSIDVIDYEDVPIMVTPADPPQEKENSSPAAPINYVTREDDLATTEQNVFHTSELVVGVCTETNDDNAVSQSDLHIPAATPTSTAAAVITARTPKSALSNPSQHHEHHGVKFLDAADEGEQQGNEGEVSPMLTNRSGVSEVTLDFGDRSPVTPKLKGKLVRSNTAGSTMSGVSQDFLQELERKRIIRRGLTRSVLELNDATSTSANDIKTISRFGFPVRKDLIHAALVVKKSVNFEQEQKLEDVTMEILVYDVGYVLGGDESMADYQNPRAKEHASKSLSKLKRAATLALLLHHSTKRYNSSVEESANLRLAMPTSLGVLIMLNVTSHREIFDELGSTTYIFLTIEQILRLETIAAYPTAVAVLADIESFSYPFQGMSESMRNSSQIDESKLNSRSGDADRAGNKPKRLLVDGDQLRATIYPCLLDAADEEAVSSLLNAIQASVKVNYNTEKGLFISVS